MINFFREVNRQKPLTKTLLKEAFKMAFVAIILFDVILGFLGLVACARSAEYATMFPYYMLSSTILGFCFGFLGRIMINYEPDCISDGGLHD